MKGNVGKARNAPDELWKEMTDCEYTVVEYMQRNFTRVGSGRRQNKLPQILKYIGKGRPRNSCRQNNVKECLYKEKAKEWGRIADLIW